MVRPGGRAVRPVLALALLLGLAACGRPAPAAPASPYARNAQAQVLAAQLSLTLLVPSSLPGTPALTVAQPIIPPPIGRSPAENQPGVRLARIGFGGVLDLTESNGGLTPAQGAATRQVAVPSAQGGAGTLWPIAYDNLRHTTTLALFVVADGTQVQLQSSQLSAAQLAAVAGGLVPVAAGASGAG